VHVLVQALAGVEVDEGIQGDRVRCKKCRHCRLLATCDSAAAVDLSTSRQENWLLGKSSGGNPKAPLPLLLHGLREPAVETFGTVKFPPMSLPGCSFQTYSPQQTLSALALAARSGFSKKLRTPRRGPLAAVVTGQTLGLFWVTALTTDGQFVSLTPHARKKSRKNRALRVLIFYAV